ncbi:MAG: TetR family transcriptional regulator [Actinomycetota bacterium]
MLTRELIVRTAIDLGLTEVSMRGLARHLGVEAPSLYHHVSDRDDLLRAGVQLLTETIEAPNDDLEWSVWLEELAHIVRRWALETPGATVLGETGPIGERTLGILATGMAKLREAGWSAALASQSLAMVTNLAMHSAARQLQWERDLADDAFGRRVEDAPIDPSLAEFVAHYRSADAEEMFAFELGCVLSGLEGRLRP